MSVAPAIDIRHVTKIFGEHPGRALDRLAAGRPKAEVQAETGQVVGLNDVSLTIEPGQIYVVMGLSGSGKSTLVRHVIRLIEPTSGAIHVHGEDVLAMDRAALRRFRRTRVAMVFQRFGLMPHRSVLDNVAYGLEIRGVGRSERHEVARRWIATVGLAGYESVRPQALSGGQQQRVGLARALALDADILLMDEAFSSLDPLIRSGLEDELLRLQAELKKTILFITHDFDEALKIGNRIAILNDGVLVQEGPPEDIVLNPADPHVEAFVAEVNKARVIRVGTIMQAETNEPCAVHVAATARCEEVLPLFADHLWVGVVDAANRRVGRIGAAEVFRALARHASSAPQNPLGTG